MTDPYATAYTQRPPVHPTSSFAAGSFQPRQRNGVAVAALVLSLVAVFGVIGIVVVWSLQIAAGSVFMGMPDDFMSDEYTLMGTAAQVVEGQPYTGERLVSEIERVLDNDWSTYQDLQCGDTPRVTAGVETSCTGTVDGMETDLTVEFEDELGHFTLVQRW